MLWDQHRHFDQVEVLNPITGYPERDIDWFKEHLFPDLKHLVKRHGLQDCNLLDVGCAAGYFTKEYAKLFRSVTGIDFSERRINEAIANNRPSNVRYGVCDITRKAPEGQFQCAIESAVFQHIDPVYRLAAFSNVKRSLVPGGMLILYDHFQETQVPAASSASWNGFIEELSIRFLKSIGGFRGGFRIVEPTVHDIGMSGGGFYIYRSILVAT